MMNGSQDILHKNLVSEGKQSGKSDKTYFAKSDGTRYDCINTSGTGSFGIVYKAMNPQTGDIVAVKRVLQDARYKVLFFLSLCFPFDLTLHFRTVNFKS